MKGDFSRLTFNPGKHYSGVLHQQGRVWLDADWNELVQDSQFLRRQELIDIIGRCGVPTPGIAFAIAPNPAAGAQPDDFLIGGGPGKLGHCYVDGLLCQLDQPASYLSQPDLPVPDRIAMPAQGQRLTAVVYVEAWQRLITFLEDPAIREVALGGPDTAARIKTVAQVKVAPVPNGSNCAGAALPGSGQGTLSTLQPANSQPADPCRLPDPAAYTGRENHLYRVEIHDAGDVLGAPGGFSFQLPLAADAAVGAISVTLSQPLTAQQSSALTRSGAVMLADNDGHQERIPLASISANGLTLTLARGLQTAFLTASSAVATGGAARFKWSRDNAAFAVAVSAISQNRLTLTVDSLGRDQASALRSGDIVEIVDDASELGAGRGHLTYLTANPDQDLFTVSLGDALPAGFNASDDTAVPPVDGRHILLRRWDGLGTAAAVFGESTTPDMNFGDGVHIQFGGLDLRPGDYWQFAARALDGSIEVLNQAPPAGVIRRRCKLAIVEWAFDAGASQPTFRVLEDCRKVFPPLTDLAEPGIHITNVFALDDNGSPTPLENDTNVVVSRVSGGIQIETDAAVDPASISRPTCFVSVEVPEGVSNTAPHRAYDQLNLVATVNAADTTVSWTPAPASQGFMSTLTSQIPAGDRGILTRLTLKGNFIWAKNNPSLYLDGEAFGVRPPDASSTLLRLPSGDKRRGGDFEMWFWLTPVPVAAPFVFVAQVSAQPIIRSEGITELVADLLLIGTGGAPTPNGAPVPLFNVTVFLNANVTSATLPNPAGAASGLDAVLLIDDPTRLNTTGFAATPAVNGAGGTGLNFKAGAAPNIFGGRLTSSNAITFTGIPIDPPGINATRILRIKNIRINASQLATATAAVNPTIVVSLSGPTAIPISNPTQTIAFAQSGAAFQVLSGPAGNTTGPGGFIRTAGSNPGLTANAADRSGVINFRLRFSERFASAFKTRSLGVVGVSQTGPQREAAFDGAGLPVTGTALPAGVGAAASGTRFRVAFTNIPPGVQLFVTTRDVPPRGTAATPPDVPPPKMILVKSDSSGAGGGAGPSTPGGVPLGTGGATSEIPIDVIPVTGGSAVAIFEWVSRDPAAATTIDQAEIGVLLAARPQGASVGTALVSMSLAPVSTLVSSSPTAPVPRFLDTSSQQTAFSVTSVVIGPIGGVTGGIVTGGIVTGGIIAGRLVGVAAPPRESTPPSDPPPAKSAPPAKKAAASKKRAASKSTRGKKQ